MRKFGFYPRLAARSLRLNGKFYLPYLLSGMVSAAMLYDILFLNMNTGVSRLKGANAVQGLLGFGALIVALFSFALICYTNGFLMKRRQKELGLYNVLGMEKRHMAWLLFWETVYSFLLCTLGGLLLGILFSKLFLLLLCAVMQTEIPFGFEVPRDAVLYTAAAFGGIFLLNYLLNLLRLNRVKPIELLHGGETGDREPKTKWVLTALGLAAMGAGYGISLTVSDPVNALILFFLAVILVLAALADFIILMVLMGYQAGSLETLSNEVVARYMEFSSAAVAVGFGGAVSLLFVAPLVLLYSYTREPANKMISMLIPVVGIVLILILFLEGIHQGVGYLPFERFNLKEMIQEVSSLTQTV